MMVSLFILLTLIAYGFSRWLYLKTNWSILNPILISIIILIVVLLILGVDYEAYSRGGQYITYFLNPIVVLLAIPLYNNREKIKDHMLPIVVGISSGILTSALTVLGLAKVFGLDQLVINSLIAKSITTPLALEVTQMNEGVKAITIVAVILTGIIGATLAPTVMKIGQVKEDVAKGVGIGSSSHGIGTAKAVEISPEAAGASGLAMGITGVVTVLLASLFYSL